MDKVYKDIFKNLIKGIVVQSEIKALEELIDVLEFDLLTEGQQAMVRNQKLHNMDFLTEMKQEDIDLFMNGISEENKNQVIDILKNWHKDYTYKFLMAMVYTVIFKIKTKYSGSQEEKDMVAKLYEKYQLK
jgi:septum formation inhibitor-activating ATPase MinD